MKGLRSTLVLACLCSAGSPFEPGTLESDGSVQAGAAPLDPGVDLQSAWIHELLDRDPLEARKRYQELSIDPDSTRAARSIATARWVEIDRLRSERALPAVRHLRSLGVVVRGRNPLRLGVRPADLHRALKDADRARLDELRQQVADAVRPGTVTLRSAVAATLATLGPTPEDDLQALRRALRSAETRGDAAEVARLNRLIENPSLRARALGPVDRVQLLRRLLAGEVDEVLDRLRAGRVRPDGSAAGGTTPASLPWPRLRRLIERRTESTLISTEERALWRVVATRLRALASDPETARYREALTLLAGR